MGKENNVFSEMAKTGGKFVGNVLFLPVKATIYAFNPKNWFNSWERVKHDTNNALGEIVGIPGKPYRGSVRMLQSSRDLGIKAEIVNGKLIFSAPRILMGDIPNLSRKQVDEIEEKYAIIVDRGGNSIGYSVNIEEIVEEVQSRSKELSKKEVKSLVVERIAEKVNFDLVGFAKITGGSFATHNDRRLMHSIGKGLYEAYEDHQNVPREIIDNPSAVPYIAKLVYVDK